MRLRLGLLQDPAVIERQIAKEVAEAEARLKASSVPTAKTEAQMKWSEERLQKEKKKIQEQARKLPRVRPLSESKAIETGANFISETFLFCVAGGIILFEYWRNKRKDTNRRDEVHERLDSLETEKLELREELYRMQIALAARGIAMPSTHETPLKVPEKEEVEKSELGKIMAPMATEATIPTK